MSGISSTCKKCDSARLKLKGEQNSARTVIEIPDRKFCSDCKEILSESRFSRAIRKNDGLHSICKECVKSRNLSNKVKVLNAIGGAICVKCHITEPEFLTVQHKLGGGNLHRRKIGWNKIYANILNDPDTTKYEVLCANCNLEESITRIVSSNSPILRKIKERRKELKRLAYQILCNGSINCACCKSVPNLNRLSIDHIVPYSVDNEGPRDTMTLYRWIISDNKSPEEQSRIRSKFQILCANCNMSKGSSGICIHKRIAFL